MYIYLFQFKKSKSQTIMSVIVNCSNIYFHSLNIVFEISSLNRYIMNIENDFPKIIFPHNFDEIGLLNCSLIFHELFYFFFF